MKHTPSAIFNSLPSHGGQNPKGTLTEMQRRFVNYHVREKMPPLAAARLAGFSSTASTSLMRNPKIIAAIAEEKEEYAIASGITKKEVLDGFLEAIEMAKTKADPLVMVSGWREIGKMCGFYEPTKSKLEISVNGKVMLERLQTLSDQELMLKVQELSALEGDFLVIDSSPEDPEGLDGADSGSPASSSVHEDDPSGL